MPPQGLKAARQEGGKRLGSHLPEGKSLLVAQRCLNPTRLMDAFVPLFTGAFPLLRTQEGERLERVCLSPRATGKWPTPRENERPRVHVAWDE